ncbi:Reverse transcriptase domain [Trinorchestia longiramus]|nr:Reverse transcriptase domain [Trinorchestia longiramus]
MGDFNTRSNIWGDHRMNDQGQLVEQLVLTNEIILLNSVNGERNNATNEQDASKTTRPLHSTTTNIAQLETNIRVTMAEKQQFAAAFFDLAKVYGTAWKYNIVKKLYTDSLRGHILYFIQNFLTDRKINVRVGGCFSDAKLLQKGVPQGSVLSCTCFLIVTNDIANDLFLFIKSSVYVDDFVIHIAGHCFESLKRQLQIAMNRLKLTSGEGTSPRTKAGFTAVSTSLRAERTVMASLTGKTSQRSSVATPDRRAAAGTPHRSRRSTASFPPADDHIEFVPISSPVGSHKRVLTPHQREKLQERRCDIPALYSDLSQQASQSFSETSCGAAASQESEAVDKKASSAVGARRSLEGASSSSWQLGTAADKRPHCRTPTAGRSTTDKNEDTAGSKNESDVVGAAKGNAETSKCAVKVLNHSSSEQNNNSINSNHSDSNSEDEIPDSQTLSINENSKSISIFSSRTRQVLGSFRSSPRIIPNIDGIEPLGNTVESEVASSASVESVASNGASVESVADSVTDNSTHHLSGTAPEFDVQHCRPQASSATKSCSKTLSVSCKPAEQAEGYHESLPLKSVVSSGQIEDKKTVASLITTPSKTKDKPVDALATPSKLTRSGRKIVPPKKGMPTPMTPPGSVSSGKKSAANKALSETPCMPKNIDSSISRKAADVPISVLQSVKKSQENGNTEEKLPATKSVQKTISEMFELTADPSTNPVGSSESTDVNLPEEEEVLPVLHKAITTQNYSRKSRKSKAEVAFENLTRKQDLKNKISGQDYTAADESSTLISNIEMNFKDSTKISANETRAVDEGDSSGPDNGFSSETQQKSGAEKIIVESVATRDNAPSPVATPVMQTPCADQSIVSQNSACQVEEQERPSNSSQETLDDVSERRSRGKRTRKSVVRNQDSRDLKNEPVRLKSSKKHKRDSSEENNKLECSASCSVPSDSDDETLVHVLLNIKKTAVNNETLPECGTDFPQIKDSVSAINQESLEKIKVDSQIDECNQSQSFLSTNSNEAPSILKDEREQTLKKNETTDLIRVENKRGRKRRRDFSDETNASVKRRNTRSQHDSTTNNVKLNDYISMRRGFKRKTNSADAECKRSTKEAIKPLHACDVKKISVTCEDSCAQEGSHTSKEVFTGAIETVTRDDLTSNVDGHEVLHNSQDNVSAEELDVCLSPSNTPKYVGTVENDGEQVTCENISAGGEQMSLSVDKEIASNISSEEMMDDSGPLSASHTSASDEVDLARAPSEEGNNAWDIHRENVPVISLRSANQSEPQLLHKEKEEVGSSNAPCDESSVNLNCASTQAEHLASSPVIERTSPSHNATPTGSTRDSEAGLDKRRSTNVRIKCGRSGSRAAFMVACAQSKMVASSPSVTFTPSRGKVSPPVSDCGGLGEKARATPPAGQRVWRSGTPRSKQLWPRHKPSPAASPGGSILKNPMVDSGSKGRRVSFADPPVSKSVVIINDEATECGELCLSPRGRSVSLSVRAQKRLDMSRATSPTHLAHYSKLTKIVDPSSLPQQPSLASLAQLVESGKDNDGTNCSEGIYKSLSGCSTSVSSLLCSLTSPALTASLEAVLVNRGLLTVGHVACLTEEDLCDLPIRPPKLQTTVSALRRFEFTLSGTTDDPANKDSSESELWELSREGCLDTCVMEVCEAVPLQDNHTNELPSTASASLEACSVPNNKTPSPLKEQMPSNVGPALPQNDTTEPDKNEISDMCDEKSFSLSKNEAEKSFIDNVSKPSTDPIGLCQNKISQPDDNGILSSTQNSHVSGSFDVPGDEVHILKSSASEEIVEDIHEDANELVNQGKASTSSISVECAALPAAASAENNVQSEGLDDVQSEGLDNVQSEGLDNVQSEGLDNVQSEGLEDNNSDKENTSPERHTSSEAGPAVGLRSEVASSTKAPAETRDVFVLQRDEGQRQVLAELSVGLERQSDEEDEEESSCSDQITSSSQEFSLRSTPSVSAFNKNVELRGLSNTSATRRCDTCEQRRVDSGRPEHVVAAVQAMSPEEQDAVLTALLPALQYTQVVDAFTHYLRHRK